MPGIGTCGNQFTSIAMTTLMRFTGQLAEGIEGKFAGSDIRNADLFNKIEDIYSKSSKTP